MKEKWKRERIRERDLSSIISAEVVSVLSIEDS